MPQNSAKELKVCKKMSEETLVWQSVWS